ncbi:hypothetical protein HRM2_17450 [Desulforapulum autotrophicum HRM2]|uniref:Uncharacterized protein n=1 Tax=Desulforapulum autotrophicum (strain ATCC 43914 / DSM 3382 / VKM B-1955 / HRM2) TaxID=177437 RepID=C0QB50_DESAH|nr:hypothetical protein HRM2_17450 [Desulforapulum autotrophicum HRM2]
MSDPEKLDKETVPILIIKFFLL